MAYSDVSQKARTKCSVPHGLQRDTSAVHGFIRVLLARCTGSCINPQSVARAVCIAL